MSVNLSRLYNEIYSDHEVRLLTTSCFQKTIDWVHIIENQEFIELLHGGELIFNTALHDATDEERKDFINQLVTMKAGGLIVSLHENQTFSKEFISYCNAIQFPLFRSGWGTSFMQIMRRFSEILLDNERKEMNLIAALKNAIRHPQDEKQYLNVFERNNFSKNMPYTITILDYKEANLSCKSEYMKRINNAIYHMDMQNIIYEENDKLILLITNYSPSYLKQIFTDLCTRYPNLHVAIGSLETDIATIHRSYENAWTTHEISQSAIPQNPLCYDEIGSYQLLANIKEKDVFYPSFVNATLGKLIDYDAEHHSDYMSILELYFKNNCSITQTANDSFYHQNTLKYKIKNMKEILGYDITENENRVKIMLSLYILRLTTNNVQN